MGKQAVYCVAVTVLAVWTQACGGGARVPGLAAGLSERECLVRAMYFESRRSSQEGLVAVGTVVMNRVASPRFPGTVCGVVGQRRQFAPGVLTRRLDPKQAGPAIRAADAVLSGARHDPVGKALHFHAATYKNPYPATYVTVAGGNAFYLRPGRRWRDAYTGSSPARSLSASARAAPASRPCETMGGAGAMSLACENEAPAR